MVNQFTAGRETEMQFGSALRAAVRHSGASTREQTQEGFYKIIPDCGRGINAEFHRFELIIAKEAS